MKFPAKKDLFLFFLLISVQINSQENILVSNGKANFRILITKNADAEEQKAAKILQNYIEDISKVSMPIISTMNIDQKKCIIVCKENNFTQKILTTKLGDDGLAIISTPSNIYLIGGEKKGIIYSIYTFIEEYLGCRMYSSNLKYIPSSNSIKVKIGLKDIQTPKFSHRQYWYMGSFRPSDEYLDWHKLHAYWNDTEWGMYMVHNINNYLPKETYFNKNPELFALVNGKRTDTQLDYSNPLLHYEVIKNFIKLKEKNPTRRVWAINPNDNEQYCQCTRCTENFKNNKSQIANVLLLVNAVAERFPEDQFVVQAFKSTRKPPLNIKPASNVNIVLSDIETNKIEGIENSTNFQNIKFRDDLQKWKKTKTDFLIWHYVAWYAHIFAPFPIFDKVQNDLQYFARQNVRGIFLEGDGGLPADFSVLKSYLFAKLLWNPFADKDSIIKDFCSFYYEGAAPEVYEYLRSLENEFNNNKTLLNSGDGISLEILNGFLSKDNVQNYRNILTKAKNKIQNNEIVRDRIDFLLLELEYIEIERERKLSKSNTPEFEKKVKNFVDGLKVLDIKFLNYYLVPLDSYLKR